MSFFPRLLQQTKKFEDERGYLEVLYESDGMVLKRSFSKVGVFRGLHVQQQPYPQTKLIRVISGAIIDFVVDVDDLSKEIYHSEIKPADDWVQIEAHLAHGFYAKEDTVFEYICDGAYNEESEVAFSIVEYLEKEMLLNNLVLSKKDLAAKPL